MSYLWSSVFLAADNMLSNVTKSPSSSNVYFSGRNRQIVKIKCYDSYNDKYYGENQRQGLQRDWAEDWSSFSWETSRNDPIRR